MVSPSSTAAAEFKQCMQEEHRAWEAVAGRRPGAPEHDAAAWSAWVRCVARSDSARRRIQSEILRGPGHEEAEVEAIPSSRPMPLSQAGGPRLRFNALLEAAGFQWADFQTTLLRLVPGAISGVNFIVTVTCTRLGLCRTYDAAHESGWLTDFQQDLEDGLFSHTNTHP